MEEICLSLEKSIQVTSVVLFSWIVPTDAFNVTRFAEPPCAAFSLCAVTRAADPVPLLQRHHRLSQRVPAGGGGGGPGERAQEARRGQHPSQPRGPPYPGLAPPAARR